MAHDRIVAGIRCLEVLERLEDYVSGDLEEDLRHQVDRHLAGCDWCERFGGEYVGIILKLRQNLGQEDLLAEDEARAWLDRLTIT